MSTFKQALVLFERGAFADAAALFSQAINANDNLALAHSKRGVCRLRLGDQQGACFDFEAALRADPRCVSALVNLGNVALERGDLDSAQQHYERALQIDETYSFAHHNMAVLLRKRGDLAGSVRELRLAARYEARPDRARKRLSFWRR